MSKNFHCSEKNYFILLKDLHKKNNIHLPELWIESIFNARL